MNSYIDKVTVFVLCLVSYAQFNLSLYMVVPVICVMIVSAFMSYMEKDLLNAIAFLLFCGC